MSINMRAIQRIMGLMLMTSALGATGWGAGSIRELNQHFSAPDGNLGSWMFIPEENVKEISTTEHPGLATIRAGEAGRDVKGITREPIKIDEYRLPWQFQLGLAQNFDVMCGVGSKTQNNSAIGMNIAVTFSDPATWPSDRSQRPPETHDFQLLIVHLGQNSGGEGLPQFTTAPHPEIYKVWGRGDLDTNVLGDWEIPAVWVGDGSWSGGPASYQHYFRCVVLSPTQLQVGIKFNASDGWNMRMIDCSRFGKITGIWEMGPIFSYDRWIPDVLCAALPKPRAYPVIASVNYEAKDFLQVRTIDFPKPQPEAPSPTHETYVDYCVFFGANPKPIEEFSDDFDIPGYLGQWQIQPQSTFVETYSRPGWLTMTLVGVGSGTGFGAVDGVDFDFKNYPPPWEIETSFEVPDDRAPWNYYLSLVLYDKDGISKGFWNPGVKNDPTTGRHEFFNNHGGKSAIEASFEPPLDPALLAAKPLFMIVQVLDPTRVRVGFKARREERWTFSKPFDCTEALGGPLSKLGMGTWSTVTGKRWGAQAGAPMYQRYMVDYIRYRQGTTENP